MTPEFVMKACTWLARFLRVDYDSYIRSSRWRAKAEAAKERAGWRCQTCNRYQGQVRLEAHHRTYERLGFEIPEDITVLCGDCHEAITQVIQSTKRRANSFSTFRPRVRRSW